MVQNVILIIVLIMAGLLGLCFISRLSGGLSRKKNTGKYKRLECHYPGKDVWDGQQR